MELIILNAMVKISSKNPYAFNGAPLPTELRQSFPITIPNKKFSISKTQKQFYIESYGCQMNFSDSEIVASILTKEGYQHTENIDNATLILINTCSIREKAEQTVRKRLELYNGLKQKNKDLKIGVLG